MRLKASHLIFVAVGAVAISPLAGARSTIYASLLKLTGLESNKTYKDAGCMVCHTTPTGGPPWNAFGLEVRKAYLANRRDMSKALLTIFQENNDTDGDGYGNALEIFAGTLPGDKNSKPTKSVKDLQAEFSKAGGIDKYKLK